MFFFGLECADYSSLFGVFPRDYEALTTYVNTNANCLWGSQLINHFEYNGAGDLAPDIRQVLIDGIEVVLGSVLLLLQI